MTLGSRLANIFLPAPTDTLVHTDVATEIAFADGQQYPPKSYANVDNRERHTKYTSMEEEEEEDRPPYLHVRQNPVPCSSYPQVLIYSVVHDRWRDWRNIGRHSDAFSRYCQDSPTR